MKIAIVDDEQTARDILTQYLSQFGKEKNCNFDVAEFCSGDDFLANFKPQYNIIIFDIEMPGINGLDTARKIRRVDKNVVILFITSMAQYAIQGYEVEALDYVLKPITYPDFALKMNKAIRRAARKKDGSISLETINGIKRLKVSEITYVEVFSHVLIYHTNEAEYKVRGSLKDIESLLMPYNFVRTYKCYIVNLNHVSEVKSGELVVGNTVIPLGRAFKKDFMQEFMRFMEGD